MSVQEAINFDTQDGAKLRAVLVERAKELARRLEDVTLSDRDTAITRGALGEVRRLLSAPVTVTKLQSYSNPGGQSKW